MLRTDPLTDGARVNRLAERARVRGRVLRGAVGPRKENVFAEMDQMDTDKDGVVTVEEMMTYFAIASTMVRNRLAARPVARQPA